MVQCLQIRPVSLKHTSTQQLLIKVFVWHSFPMKKFLKLIASVILEHAKMFNSKNVKFIFYFSAFGDKNSIFRLRFFGFFDLESLICSFDFSVLIIDKKFLVFIIVKFYPNGWRRLIDFSNSVMVEECTLPSYVEKNDFSKFSRFLEHQQVSKLFHFEIDII